jgi:NAD-dependent dihydropyrimidine dehydrogenase PreA subunit
MIVEQETCAGGLECIPYCPIQAIKIKDEKAWIDLDLCVECGACIRSEVCPTQALYIQELHWPRTIRAAFSGTNYYSGYKQLLEKKPMPKREFDIAKYWGGGRGTSEMKTNDVTDRFKAGEVGIGCEFGRPGVAFCFRDLEKLTMRLVENGVQLLVMNPVTKLLNPNTGRIKKEYEDIRDERALTAIVEFKLKIEKAIDILRLIQDISKEIETVFSLNIINRCKDGAIPFKSMLDGAGIEVAINGKTCIGLGRIPT